MLSPYGRERKRFGTQARVGDRQAAVAVCTNAVTGSMQGKATRVQVQRCRGTPVGGEVRGQRRQRNQQAARRIAAQARMLR